MKIRITLSAAILLLAHGACCLASGATLPSENTPQDCRWGDLGDGTFANPVLNADYSDPDVIRVGDRYYMTCSEFHFMGMLVLESEDMVNWRIIGHIFSSIDLPGYSEMRKYGGGSWAPALRYHDGKFYMYVCTPEEGLFMSTAENPAGPWSPLHKVKNVSGWEDPCPLWDDNGNAFLGRSQLGGGPIYIHRMSADGRTLLDEGVKVYEGPVAEGTKLFMKDGYYYMSIPEGGVSTGWQQVLRSSDIYGPYEGRRVLEQGSTDVNGPHQGALVDTPDGQWWFYHFQSAGARGRVVHLQPVVWTDGFPFIGVDYDGNGIGEPVKVCKKPAAGKSAEPHAPQTSDMFDAAGLAVQWQFNHNPELSRLSLTERPGWLAVRPLPAARLREARNQLTQKIMGFESRATVKIDFSQLAVGSRCGLECIGNKFMAIGVQAEIVAGQRKDVIYMERDGEVQVVRPVPVDADGVVYLRLDIDTPRNAFQFMYSFDGKTFDKAGEPFEMSDGDWKGCRTGIYCYTTDESAAGGPALFDWFVYDTDGPGNLKVTEN